MVSRISYEPRRKQPAASRTALGIMEAIGFAGLICIGMLVAVVFYVTYVL